MFEDLEIWTNMRDYEDFIPLSWIKSIQYYQTQQWDLFRTETDYGACEHIYMGNPDKNGANTFDIWRILLPPDPDLKNI